MTYAKLVFSLLLLAGQLEAARGAEDPFAAGLRAARDGAFEEALVQFSAARDAGESTPVLLYNLGVVNFKLGRLDAAEAAFTRLTTDPSWRALAHYNLGLVEALTDPQAATHHFRQAQALTTSPKLRALAERKLHGGAPAPSAPARRWYGLVSLAGGYDDNVVLTDDRLIGSVSDEADQFGEVLAVARRPLSGAARRGWTFDLSAYYRAHAQLDDFDFGALSAALLWRTPLGAWRLSTGLEGKTQFAGGESYANVASYRLEVERRAGSARWRARNDLSYVSGGTRFDYISGWRNTTQLQATYDLDSSELRVGYEFEQNDRDDLQTEEQFFSYSPSWHRLYSSLDFDVTDRFGLELVGDIRFSHYDDRNRFFDEADRLVDVHRDQELVSAGISVSYRIARQWHVWSRYRYTDSASKIERYRYDNNTLTLSLEAMF